MAGYTHAQLVAIKQAYASGVTTVDYDGKRISYRSLDEMRQIIATIEADLAAQSGRKRPIAGFASFRRS